MTLNLPRLELTNTLKRTNSVLPYDGSTGQQYWHRAVPSSKLGGKGRATFVDPTFLEISGNEQQGATRSPVGRRREPLLVWQGEMLLCHRRDSSVAEEGGQLDRRVVFGPRDDVFVETSFSERSQCCCRRCTAVVATKPYGGA